MGRLLLGHILSVYNKTILYIYCPQTTTTEKSGNLQIFRHNPISRENFYVTWLFYNIMVYNED